MYKNSIKLIGQMLVFLLIPAAFLFIFSSQAQAVVGLTVGNSTLNLGATENLIYGNIGTASSPTSNYLLFQKNGSSLFNLDSSGNLLTTGSITANTFAGSITSGSISSANVSTGAFGSNTGGGTYSFPGNVGIGTTNPGYKLDVNGDARFGGDDFIWNNEYKKQVANRVAGAANSRSEIRIPWPGTTSGPIILDVEVMIDTGSVSARHYVKKRFYLASYSGYVAGDLYSQSSYVVDSMDGNADRYNYIDVFEEDTVNGRIVLPIYAGPTAGQNKSIVITAWGTKEVAAWIEGATFHSDVQVGITPPARAAVQAPPADNFVFSNNVGIGITNPTAKLEVVGAINSNSTVNGIGLCIAGDCKVSWDDVGGGNSWNLDGNTVGQNTSFGTNDNYSVIFKTNNAERARLTNTGNLALGATTTGTRLHVESPQGAVAFFKSTLNGGSYAGYIGNGQTYSSEEFGLYYALNDTRLASYNLTNGLSIYGGHLGDDAALVINSAGYVGIGNTNPQASLDVSGSGTMRVGYLDYGQIRLGWDMYGGDASVYAYTPTYGEKLLIGMYDGNYSIGEDPYNPIMFIAGSTHNIGINSTNPTTRLSVVGDGTYSIDAGNNRIGNVSTPVSATDAANRSFVESAIATATSSISTLWGGTTGGNVWNLNSGNVGIGTTNPGSKLELSASSTGGFVYTTVRNVDVTNSSSGAGIIFIPTTAGWGPAIYTDRGGKGNSGGLYFGTTDAGGGTSFDADKIRMVINNLGNVGIGTTSPSQKLDVVGKISLNDGGNSVFIGEGAGLNDDASDNRNVGIGYQSLHSNTTGSYNTANGYLSLYSNTTGSNNTANGYQSLRYNTTGGGNTANGYQSLFSNTTGGGNTANGNYSLHSNTTGSYNTANGYYSLFYNTTGIYNTANGYYSLFSNTTGGGNTANGYQSLRYNTTGGGNTANGYQSLYSNTTGIYNTANGYQSLRSNTTGSYNTANGNFSLYFNTTGSYNTANGYYSLFNNTTGSQNTANGYYSLVYNTTGNNNTANGYYSLLSNTTGNNNTALGYNAGRNINDGGHNETSSNSLYLGYDTRASLSGNTNEIVIGHSALGGGSDSVTLGNDSITKTILKGNVGIATTNPGTRLTVVGDGTYSIDAGNNRIGNVAAPVNATDAVNRTYLDSAIATATSSISTLWGGTTGGNVWNLNSDNVGIGTTAPAQQLEITKNFRLPSTTGTSPYGIVYKGTSPFIHDFNYGLNSNSITTNGYNTFVGVDAGNLTMGSTATAANESSMHTVVGYRALRRNTTGYSNTALGTQALEYNNTGRDNTAVGVLALNKNTTGYYNTAVGSLSLFYNSTGYNNTAVGERSLSSNTTGTYNTAMGTQALWLNDTGYYNAAYGSQSLYDNTTGIYNTAIGTLSLHHNAAGNNNSALGYLSGKAIANGSNNTSSSYSVFLGFDTRALAASQTNEIVIGSTATGNGSNSVTLGNDSITKTILKGNVGIGTTDPAAKLQVNGTSIFYQPIQTVAPTAANHAVTRSYMEDSITAAVAGVTGTFTLSCGNVEVKNGLIIGTTCPLQ